jgi:two-component system, chemotaxis family, chemotaxis protein CheY
VKALVVDDSMVMRKILVGALGGLGIDQVTQAGDGAEAVAAVTAGDFGIILMDWNMPKMLGIDALKAIRAAGKTTPVVMVTTEAEKSRILEALKAGATSYIVKPFDPGTLSAKIKAVIDKVYGAKA